MCCHLQEEDVDRKIDELWEKVYNNGIHRSEMDSWILCFSDSPDDGIPKCKQEIKKSLTDSEHQADLRNSFLTRLLTNDPPLAGYEYGTLVNYCKIT